MYVCKCVRMYGYAFRHALKYGAETWLGARGQAHKVWEYIYEAIPPKVNGHTEVKLL